MNKRYAFIFVSLVSILRLSAQTTSGDEGFGDPRFIVSTADNVANPTDILPTDLNGDGSLDMLFIADGSDELAWFANDGQGNFGELQLIEELLNPRDVGAADLDGDGDTDVLVTYFNGLTWYANDGQGNFDEGQTIIDASGEAGVRRFFTGITTTDLDRDGDVDLLLSDTFGDSGRLLWYQNDGQGNFSELVIADSANDPVETYAADLDGDGDPDAVVATDAGTTWYANDGQGNFGEPQPVGAMASFEILVADLDGDSDLDVVSVVDSSRTDDAIVWYANDGQGNFEAPVLIDTRFGLIAAIYAADLDEDGDTDVVYDADDKVAWRANDGQGNFGKPQIISSRTFDVTAVYAADLDGDSDVDVASASLDDKLAWYANDGQGNFGEQQLISSLLDQVTAIYPADYNTDNDQDVLIVSEQETAWYANDGQGNFERAVPVTIDGTIYDLPDLDGDGDPDVLATPSSTLAWYANDGQGNFGEPQTIADPTNPIEEVYSADLDADGDSDILLLISDSFSNPGSGQLLWYANDGQGNFEEAQTIATQLSSPADVAAGDLDQDGDSDVLLSGGGNSDLAWYANDGQGNFGEPQTLEDQVTVAASVRVADLDNDGDQDVLAEVSLSTEVFDLVWYKNHGQGNFERQEPITIFDSFASITLADFDSDGDQDVLTSNSDSFTSASSLIVWHENNGQGIFNSRIVANGDEIALGEPAFAVDLNGDSRSDVLTFNSSGSSSVFWFENLLNPATPTSIAFALIDTQTDQEVSPLTSGDTIAIAAPDLPQFTVQATPGATVDSVRLVLTGPIEQARIERVAPYALFGNQDNDFFGVAPLPGQYTLTATLFRQGTPTTETTIDFTLVLTGLIESFTLINASDDQEVTLLQEGITIDLATLGTSDLSVRANAAQPIDRVVLTLDGPLSYQKTEIIAPYTLFGNRGSEYFGQPLLPGNYTLTAVPLVSSSADSYQLLAGEASQVSFTLAGEASSITQVYPNRFDQELFIVTEDPHAVQIRLQSVAGQVLVVEPRHITQEATGLRLNTQHVQAGHYVLQMVGTQGTQTWHVIKE